MPDDGIHQEPTTPVPQASPTDEVGEVDAAKAALARARAAARAARESGQDAGSGPAPASASPGSRPSGGAAGRGTAVRGRSLDPGEAPRSGPGPDGRDPLRLGPAVERLVAERGWEAESAVGSLVGRWDQIVGADVAGHVQVEAYEAETGKLVLRADSTAWATQVRLLLPALGGRLREELGRDAVRELVVLGPAAPSWVKGPRVAPGRGPRDTYG